VALKAAAKPVGKIVILSHWFDDRRGVNRLVVWPFFLSLPY
jgi:hypothetical protein